jgi:2-phosphoglycerate kinase
MAKIFVVDSAEQTRAPFLRGVMTRSLHDAGMSFEDAYKLASNIRDSLAEKDEVTTTDLRARVLAALRKDYPRRVADAYETSAAKPSTILVRDQDNQVTPFSRSQHYLCLESSGLSNEDAANATTRVYQHLLEQGVTEITSSRIGHLTYCCLAKMFGKPEAHRYMVWVHYTHSGRPLMLLIGGTTGTGKSTMATEIAHRLGIVRTQSTDMLREVMRMLVPERLLPVLHTSSFNAWQALQPQSASSGAGPDAVADGYRTQSELLSLPIEAVIQRALRERVSLILEGIHVHPMLLDRIQDRGDAIIVPIMLAVLKQKQLKKRLIGRGINAPQREAERQLSYFEAIWSLQEHLLSEADRAHVPIIANEDKENAIRVVLHTIIDALSENFSSTPREAFL